MLSGICAILLVKPRDRPDQHTHEAMDVSKKPPLWTSALIQVLVVNCVVFVSFQMLVPVLPLYVSTIGGNEAVIGLVVGALAFAGMPVRPFAGWLVDQWGRRIIMIASIAIFAATGFAYPFAASVASLLVIRIVQGVGWSGVFPSVGAVVADLTPPQRLGEGLAYQSTSQSLAMAIGPAAGLFILKSAGYTTAFLTAAALGLVAFLLSLRLRFPYTPPPEARERFSLRALVETSSLAPSAITALTTFLFGGLTTFVPLVALDRHLGDPSVFFVTFAIALVIIRPIVGRISDRRLQRGVFLLPGLGLIASCLLILALVDAAWTLAATGLLWAAGFGITQPILRAMAVDRVPQDSWGAANATMATAYEAGLGAGALLLGILATQVGVSTMFALSSLVPAVAAALVLRWGLHRT